MKNIEKYVCDFCNVEYADKRIAEQCESNHKKTKGICACRWLPWAHDKVGTPYEITVEMINGEKVKYRRIKA